MCAFLWNALTVLAKNSATNKVMYRPWSLAFQDTTICYGMCVSQVTGSAAARSMASMVSCNSVTTSTLGLAAILANSDVIMLPRTSLSHLQSYLLPARFILNFYVSCGCWLTCIQSSTSISLGTKRTSGISDSGGVWLAHSAIIGMRLALPLHTLQPYALICQYMAPLTPRVPLLFALDQQLIVSSAAPLTFLILVNRETLLQARLLSVALSAAILSLALVQVQSGGVAILRWFLACLQASFPVLLTLLQAFRRRAVVTTCLRKVKHHITAPLRVPRLAVPPLALTVSTRKPMFARMPLS